MRLAVTLTTIFLCAQTLAGSAVICAVPAETGLQVIQQVLIVHRAGHQEMVIRALPQWRGTAPKSLAWVISLPSPPTRYAEVGPAVLEQSRQLHDKLFTLARDQWSARTDFSIIPSAQGGAEIHSEQLLPNVKVGSFTITALPQRGAPGVKALNAWLLDNGFALPGDQRLRWFAEHDFTFLCARCDVPGNAANVETPALQIGFDSENAYYPALLGLGAGEFSAALTIISDRPMTRESMLRARLRLNDNERVDLDNLWTMQPLPAAIVQVAGGQAGEVDRWFVNSISSRGFSTAPAPGSPLDVLWKDDVFFVPGGSDDEIAGFWYYADIEISWHERVFREHALAIVVTFSVALLVVLVLKGRQNRRLWLKEQGITPPAKSA